MKTSRKGVDEVEGQAARDIYRPGADAGHAGHPEASEAGAATATPAPTAERVAAHIDKLWDAFCDQLANHRPERFGVRTVEVVGEELGTPVVAVFCDDDRARVLLLAGGLGATYTRRTVAALRAGRLAPLAPDLPTILVHPRPDDGTEGLARELGLVLTRGARGGAREVVEVLSTLHAAAGASNRQATEDHSVPAATPEARTEATKTGRPEPDATGQDQPPAASSSDSAARDFALASLPADPQTGARASVRIFSPEEREARIAARLAAEREQNSHTGSRIGRLWPFSRQAGGRNRAAAGIEPATAKVAPEPVVFPRLSPQVIQRLHNSPFPSLFAFVNNKGGVGKTSVAIGTAAAFSQMGRSEAGPEALRVLVVEQNFLNPDIESRMQLRPGSIRGLGAYIEDLLAAIEDGRFAPEHEGSGSPPFDVTPYTSKSYVENLDVLLIGKREDERRIAEEYLPEVAFEMVFRELYRSLGASYDVVCVDLANSRPEADRGEATRTASARLIGFNASAADGIYVPFDASETSFAQARRVVAEARELCVEEDTPGVPPMAGVVPILNCFPEARPGDATWMEDDEEEAWRLEHEYLPAVGADHAILPGYEPGTVTLKVPDYKEVTRYNNAGRIICLESARFARAYIPIVMDAAARAYENQGIRAQAGTPQAGTPQAGTPQAGTPQAGTPQAGTPQAGTPQAGTPQAGTPQAGTPQAGTPQAGTRTNASTEAQVSQR